MELKNFLTITENIATAGQPLEADFKTIADNGYNAVVNFAMAASENALPNEGDIVTGLGMFYVHIPVIWQQPKIEHFQLFAAVMQRLPTHKVLVHCTLNMRVSAFMYAYSLLYLDMPQAQAQANMEKVWQPNETWANFIEQVLAAN